jgi:hypothetical protein
MKKIFLLAIMAVMSLASQAQIVSSRSSMVTKEEAPKNGWSTFSIDYMPGSFSADKGTDKKSQSYNAFGFTWTKASSLTPQLPLFLEFGFGTQYLYFKEDFKLYGYDFEQTGSMASVKVPLNIIYSYQIPNTEISIDPFVGLYARVNVWGKTTLKEDVPGYAVDDSWNIFDKDDMGDEDATWGRFQLGWQIGVKARFANSFFVGASYGSDFSNIVKNAAFLDTKAENISYVEKVTMNQATLSLGFIF